MVAADTRYAGRDMRSFAALALALSVFGCEPSTRGPPRIVVPVDLTPPAPPVASASPSPPVDGSPARRAGKALLTIPVPNPVACELTSPQVGYRRIPLALRAGGAPFGAILPPRGLTMFIPKGDASLGLTAEADVGGAFIRGVARAESIPLHPIRVSVFEGFVVPLSRADLHVVRAGDEGVELSLALPPQVTMATKSTVSATLPCDIVALTAEEFDPMQNLLGMPIDTAVWTGATSPLATSVGGAPVAMVNPHDVDRRVSVLAREKNRVKIAWEVGDVVVFGWVDTQKLRAPKREEDVFGAGGLGLSGIGEGVPRTLVCEVELPLRAEVDGASEIVGVVAPGTRIEIVGERADALEVELPTTGLIREPGATLIVDNDLARRCVSP